MEKTITIAGKVCGGSMLSVYTAIASLKSKAIVSRSNDKLLNKIVQQVCTDQNKGFTKIPFHLEPHLELWNLKVPNNAK